MLDNVWISSTDPSVKRFQCHNLLIKWSFNGKTCNAWYANECNHLGCLNSGQPATSGAGTDIIPTVTNQLYHSLSFVGKLFCYPASSRLWLSHFRNWQTQTFPSKFRYWCTPVIPREVIADTSAHKRGFPGSRVAKDEDLVGANLLLALPSPTLLLHLHQPTSLPTALLSLGTQALSPPALDVNSSLSTKWFLQHHCPVLKIGICRHYMF